MSTDWIPDPNAQPVEQEVQRGENIEQERIDHAVLVEEQARGLVALGFQRGRDSIAKPEDDFYVELGVWPLIVFTELGAANVLAKIDYMKAAIEQGQTLLGSKVLASEKKIAKDLFKRALEMVEGPPPAEDE